jgi:hypothetical protein
MSVGREKQIRTPAKLWRPLFMLAACLFLLLSSLTASAADVRLAGFGTLGFAVLDEDLRYLRYIDEKGTLKADSLIGAQMEVRFNPRWGATVQAVASAPRDRDAGQEAKVRWAFLSFRPSNEWLFRAGRLRPPVLLNTQNAEVGVTYDEVRLPVEVYSLSPVYDIDGAAVTRTWSLANREVSLDAYWGKTELGFRLPFQRDPTQTFFPQEYFPERITFTGLVLSQAYSAVLLRAGAHHATVKAGPGRALGETFIATTFPAPPPFGGTLYVPGREIDKIDVTVFTFGAEWRSGNWRITGEYGQRIVNDSKLGVDSKSGYVTVARGIGKWTPYATYARLLSGSDVRALYREVNDTPVPLGAQAPPVSLPANFHRILADQIWVYDQYSTMLGTAYSFSATSKLKFEWMRTKVGLASALVDGDVHNRHFNVYSASYSVAF